MPRGVLLLSAAVILAALIGARAQLGVCTTEDQLAIAVVVKPLAEACVGVPEQPCSDGCRKGLAINAHFSDDQLSCISTLQAGKKIEGSVIPANIARFLQTSPSIVAGE